ncbi:hypothetical protein F4824DRAFT_498441 [Ustulina deusta]|nr:hypothetical protein F4824DRAFT_498441 [Ustulina deusta]
MSSFERYIDDCEFLGLAWEPAKDGENIGANSFVHLDHASRVGGKSGFHISPAEFFKILDNRPLSSEDFE